MRLRESLISFQSRLVFQGHRYKDSANHMFLILIDEDITSGHKFTQRNPISAAMVEGFKWNIFWELSAFFAHFVCFFLIGCSGIPINSFKWELNDSKTKTSCVKKFQK